MYSGNNKFQKLAKYFGERKFAYVVFCDVSGSTELAKTLEPEIFGMLMYRLEKCVRGVVSEPSYGGEYVKSLGDGFLSAFGYPELKDNQAELVVKAMLEIKQRIDTFIAEYDLHEFNLKVHMGAHAGTCIITDETNGCRDYLGDPVNLAKKICDFAEPGEITISEDALGRARDKFVMASSQAIRIAGQTEKFVVSRVISENDDGDISLSQTGAFAGRRQEIGWLMERLTQTGTNLTAMIHAEAGLGKSRLIRELTPRLAQTGISVHIGQCEADYSSRPYKTLDHILYSIFRSEYGTSPEKTHRLKTNLPPATIQLAELLKKPLALNGTNQKFRVKFEALFLQLLQSLSGSILLVFDDWQWIDNASQKIVQNILEAKLPQVKILFASRNRDPVFEEIYNIHVLSLEPLDHSSVEDIVRFLLPSYDPFTLEHIHEYSGGNPLYLEELCHSFRDQGLNNITDMSAGTWLSALINTRSEKLSSELSKIIRTSAVIGHIIPEWLLSDVLGNQLDNQKLEALRNADFIYPAETKGRLRFKHGITRDVIYQQVGLEDRRKLHNKVITSLHSRAAERGQTESHEQLAYHYGQSGNSEKAVHYSQLAGDTALAVTSLDKAQIQYKAALKHLYQLAPSSYIQTEINSVLRKYGQAAIVDPSWEQIPVLLDAKNHLSKFENPKMCAWIEFWLGFLLYGLGEPLKAIEHLEASKRQAEKINAKKLLVHIDANLGQAYGSGCRYQDSEELLTGAIKEKRTLGNSTQLLTGLAYSISCLGFVKADQGRFEESDATFGQAKSIINGLALPMSTWLANQWSASKIWEGDFKKGYYYADQARQIAQKNKSRYHFVMAQSLMVGAKLSQNNHRDHINRLVETTQWLSEKGSQQFTSLNHGWLARAFAKSGEFELARDYAAKAFQRARKGDRLGEAMAARAMALVAKQGGSRQPPIFYMNWADSSATKRMSEHEKLKNVAWKAEYFS